MHAEILQHTANVLSQAQREKYFTDGYVGLPGLVGEDWMQRLQKVTNEFIEISRSVSNGSNGGAKDKRFDLEPDHTAAAQAHEREDAGVQHQHLAHGAERTIGLAERAHVSAGLVQSWV